MGDNSNHEARSRLPEESRTGSRAEPTENKMNREGTQSPGAQDPTTMDNSQQPPPAQARMRCCGKDDLRDCDCLKPQGPCETPVFIFTHYNHECACYSCEWIREARKKEVPNHLCESKGKIIENCSFSGDRLEKVYNSGATRYCNDLELVYPTMVQQGPPQEWGWAFQSTNLQQLPYLADLSQCPKFKMATLDSHGQWKGVRRSGKSVRLQVFHQIPMWDKLYRDFGYDPNCSPYKYSLECPRRPDMDPKDNSMVPPTKLRQYAADQSNTTVFIGGIDKTVDTDDLRWLFGKYGQIRYYSRPFENNAFIQFALRRDALMVMRQLQGVPVYNHRLRLCWADPKVINQDELEVRGEPSRVRGSRHRAPPRPWHVQERQLYDHRRQAQAWVQPARAAPANVVWYHHDYPLGQQQAAQQQMGYVNQLWTVPPPPGPEHRAPSSGPAEPQDARGGRPFELDPRVAPWKRDPKGKGRRVVSSGMVPDPSEQQPPREQPHEIFLAPYPKSQRTDAGSGSDCPSNASTDPSSLEEKGSPKKKAGSNKEKGRDDTEHPGQ